MIQDHIKPIMLIDLQHCQQWSITSRDVKEFCYHSTNRTAKPLPVYIYLMVYIIISPTTTTLFIYILLPTCQRPFTLLDSWIKSMKAQRMQQNDNRCSAFAVVGGHVKDYAFKA